MLLLWLQTWRLSSVVAEEGALVVPPLADGGCHKTQTETLRKRKATYTQDVKNGSNLISLQAEALTHSLEDGR